MKPQSVIVVLRGESQYGVRVSSSTTSPPHCPSGVKTHQLIPLSPLVPWARGYPQRGAIASPPPFLLRSQWRTALASSLPATDLAPPFHDTIDTSLVRFDGDPLCFCTPRFESEPGAHSNPAPFAVLFQKHRRRPSLGLLIEQLITVSTAVAPQAPPRAALGHPPARIASPERPRDAPPHCSPRRPLLVVLLSDLAAVSAFLHSPRAVRPTKTRTHRPRRPVAALRVRFSTVASDLSPSRRANSAL